MPLLKASFVQTQTGRPVFTAIACLAATALLFIAFGRSLLAWGRWALILFALLFPIEVGVFLLRLDPTDTYTTPVGLLAAFFAASAALLPGFYAFFEATPDEEPCSA